MKNYLLFVLITLGVISCRSKQGDKEVLKQDSAKIAVPSDSLAVKTDSHYFWSSELEPGKGVVMHRIRPLPDDSLHADSLIQWLNGTYPDIPLRYSKISNDTIFVRIIRSIYLTQQMGSSGAQAYLAELTFNLTELKDIHYVAIRFRAGDHASPDIYCRTDFVKLN